ncbi:MAG: AmmeMemoRadiSam system protein A [Actinomyces sp.]|nr:MAG: AmmeMemoRadiSam system protein A [Actinomyces sp.]
MSPATLARLPEVAAEAIRARFEQRPLRLPPDLPAEVRQPGAAFVTLTDGDRLLGCIGSLEPVRPLVDDVAHNAVQAAFADPRMPPLTPDEFARMTIEVSVLSPLEPLPVGSFAELARVVRPGVDGLVVAAAGRRGTFLPSVWEQLPTVEEFLRGLWLKAGLRPGWWPPDTRVWRYTTSVVADPGPRSRPRRAGSSGTR